MNEVIGTARNIVYVLDQDNKIVPQIETVLIVSQPVYGISKDTGLTKFFETDTVRFSASPEGLRNLANILIVWAQEAEDNVPIVKNV